MYSPFLRRPKVRQRVVTPPAKRRPRMPHETRHRPTEQPVARCPPATAGPPIKRRNARTFPCFSGRRISVVIRLLPRWKFVDRRHNSIDQPSNEFDMQGPEKALSFPPSGSIWVRTTIFVVFAAHRKSPNAELGPWRWPFAEACRTFVAVA